VQNVAATPQTPLVIDTSSTTPPAFTWPAGQTPPITSPFPPEGPPPVLVNDSFVVRIYDSGLRHVLYESPPVTDTTFTLPVDAWNAVRMHRGSLHWMVWASANATTATGPYPSASLG
jgi:hypothetical protein